MNTLRYILCGLIPSLLGLICCVAIAVAADTPAPQISLSLRGVGDDTVEQGEPLRITVRLTAPRGFAEAIELAPASGNWSDAIVVELVPAIGGVAVARGEAVGKAATPSATLSPTRVAGGLWLISSAAMQRVAPGDYVVQAKLAIQGGGGWHGEVDTDQTPLQVVAVSDSAYRVSQHAINRAHEALLSGRIEEAASIVDAVLQHTPDDVRLLTVRGDIADRAGNPLAALICLSRAQRTNSPGGVGPPSLEREALEARARAAFLGDKLPPTNPPAWSWPPSAVIAVPEAELLAMARGSTTPQGGITPVPVSSGEGTTAAPAVSAVSPAPAQASSAIAAGPGNFTVVSSSELKDATIIADPAGQWAVDAAAGTKYGKTQYSPAQATGAPNISIAGNSPDAWCPETKDRGIDWLELAFAKPVHATEVRIRQNDAAGAIIKIEAIEPDGTAHVWWEGVDPYRAPSVREIVWFAVRVPKTSYLVAKVKITLNLAAGPGWKEIDAVQLVGAAQ
jgi:hypothetical protein